MTDFNAPAGVLIKTTLVDFPGRVACAFFFAGCNLKCPYCYNKGLVNSPFDTANFISLNQLFLHLEKRRTVLSGLVLSGGEALLNPSLPEVISRAKKLGYFIKLDTNGTEPEKLKALYESPETTPDYVAMDIKTSPEKYKTTLLPAFSEPEKLIYQTIDFLSSLPPSKREFRTVMVPGLVDASDIEKISSILPHNASWFLADFKNNDCLDESFCSHKPYSIQELNEFTELAQKKIPSATLR